MATETGSGNGHLKHHVEWGRPELLSKEPLTTSGMQRDVEMNPYEVSLHHVRPRSPYSDYEWRLWRSFYRSMEILRDPDELAPSNLVRHIIATESLYRDRTGKVGMALALSHSLDELIAEAIDELDSANTYSADDALRRARMTVLPELFCLREIGDGFAMLVDAIRVALDFFKNQPPERKHLGAIQQAVSRLREEPFMNDNTAIKALIAMEQVGLMTEPEYLGQLGDALELDSHADAESES